MVWKKVNNSDAGTSTKHGGNDIDKITDAFNGVDVSDPIIYNVSNNTLRDNTNTAGNLLKNNGTKFVSFPKGTANQVLKVNAGATDLEWAAETGGGGGATSLDGLSDVAITSPARGDIIIRDATQYKNLAKGTSGQILKMDGAGNEPIWGNEAVTSLKQSYTYLIYKDAGGYKAQNGQTGNIDYSHATDVTNLLDAIVDAISPAGTSTMIEIGPGDFNMTTVFNNITSASVGNITIRGQGIGVTNLIATSSISSGAIFDVQGAVSGSQTNLSADINLMDLTFTVADASSFAVGDTYLLRSTAAFSTAASAQGKKGEIHKLVAKSGNVITFDKWAHDTYTTATIGNIIKLAMLKNITIENLSLKAGSGYTATGAFFYFNYCDNLRLNNVHVQDPRGTGFELSSCINFKTDVICEQTPGATFNSQYGFKPTCASENGHCHVVGIGKWRHTVTIDASTSANREGQVRNIEFSGSAETNDEAAWDTHATGENISFRGCNVHGTRNNAGGGDAKGFQMRAKRCNVQNCNVWQAIGKGVTIMEDASGSIVSDCNINLSHDLDNNTLGYGIEIRASTNGVVITGNNIGGSVREAILIRSSSSGHVITGNIIDGSSNEGIDGADITDVVVSGNRIVNCSKAINMAGTSNYWVITGNNFHTNTSGSTIIGANTINQNNAT